MQIINTKDVGPYSGKISDVFSLVWAASCNLQHLAASSVQIEFCQDELSLLRHLSTCGKRKEREGKWVCVREEKTRKRGGEIAFFRCPVDLKSALCHVVKLCFRQRCFVWVITAALAAKTSDRIHSYIYTLKSPSLLAEFIWPVETQPLSCPLVHLHYLM